MYFICRVSPNVAILFEKDTLASVKPKLSSIQFCAAFQAGARSPIVFIAFPRLCIYPPTSFFADVLWLLVLKKWCPNKIHTAEGFQIGKALPLPSVLGEQDYQ